MPRRIDWVVGSGVLEATVLTRASQIGIYKNVTTMHALPPALLLQCTSVGPLASSHDLVLYVDVSRVDVGPCSEPLLSVLRPEVTAAARRGRLVGPV